MGSVQLPTIAGLILGSRCRITTKAVGRKTRLKTFKDPAIFEGPPFLITLKPAQQVLQPVRIDPRQAKVRGAFVLRRKCRPPRCRNVDFASKPREIRCHSRCW